MGKHDFLTPKAISNRIKAKGLQKLRWYCQVCEKQCRDENGFKCHSQSEAHLRQMRVFSDNPGRFVSNYSREFESAFMAILRLRGRQRVFANAVYQEVIKDRHHIHMKATAWTTLSGFVQYLAKTGKATIEESPRGWYITYVDQDPKSIEKQRVLENMKRMEEDDKLRNEKRIQRIMEAAHEQAAAKNSSSSTSSSSHSIEKDESQGPIKLNLVASKKATLKRSATVAGISFDEEDEEVKQIPSLKAAKVEEEPEQLDAEHAWVTPGIVVKILNEEIGDGKYYKMKALVVGVEHGFVAEVKLLKTEEPIVLKLDQTDLETVLPALGSKVLFVGPGKYNGSTARLDSIHERDYNASIKILDGDHKGKYVDGVRYDDICKLVE
eukprot:TRINITY_DN8737_c0_g1_i1.p1 TRINITY_DN8737_c0_g1~~TRINITY_DN8737_c0_g1_i1.p1  ORF type:complete len:388 (-),score=100.93 TRINITY_DN8737_c0_g1_i1:25-1167(-)